MQKFGTLLSLTLISLAAAFILTTHHAAAASEYCFMLGDPTNGSTANSACLAGQTAPPELSGLSSGMSSSALQNTFINDMRSYANKPYPVDKVGVAYIVAQLQQRGGNWETNLGLTTLTVEDSSVAGCANTAYDPASNSVVHISDCPTGPALIARQNGQIVFAIRIDCGNVLGNFPGPAPDRPPTGSVTLTCNTDGSAVVKLSFSDPDGSTSAKLTINYAGGSSGGPFVYSASGTYTRAVTAAQANGSWGASLLVNDAGGSQDKTFSASGGSCNKAPAGSVGAAQCNASNNTYTIKVTFSDGNGTTQARLIGKDGKQYGTTATAPGTTWTLQTSATPRTAFPMTFEVGDMDGGKIISWVTKGTLSLTGAMNCAPRDDITAVSCHAVSIKLWDPNAPTTSIQFRVGLNGGAPEGGGTFNGGQNGGNQTYNLAGLSDFDPWINDKVTLYGLDADSGNNAVVVGTITLPGNVCNSLQCSTSSLPGTGLVAKEPTSFYVTEKIIAPSDAPNLGNVGPKNAHFTIQISPSLNDTRAYATPVSSATLQSTPDDVFTPPDSGNYNLAWQLVGGEAPGAPSCGKTVQAGYEPFFTIEGGDIAAGPGFGAGCTQQSTPADITGYNLDNPAFGSYSYFGAGSQLGAFANGNVTHFVTDSTNVQSTNRSVSTNGSTTVPYTSPTGLSFSNSSAAPTTTYGGGFDRSAGWCVPDYESKAEATSSGAPDYATPGTRTYTLPANSTIGNITVQPGARVTLIATGNVYINGDITYNDSYTVADGDITQVPQFTLLIKGGNLYINNTVATLNGFYDVQPNGNTGGTLYTCASGLGADYGQNYSACNHPLTFYGAVSAAKLKLGRTYGSLISAGGAPNVPSERFVYTPELWLGNLVGPSCKDDPTSLGCLYQAYTALPPVL